jgi:hypothetical protein
MLQLPTDLKDPPQPRIATGITVSAELRHRMIAEAAYYLAEKRNFQGGDPVNDWLEAERIIDQALQSGVKPRLALKFLSTVWPD